MPAPPQPAIAYEKGHLNQLIKEAHLQGLGASLNHIDVSRIKDFSYLFSNMHFSSDMSQWDMRNAKDLSGMFRDSKWNGDLSKWDVSNVRTMDTMFRRSSFSGDISGWNTSRVTSMAQMFEGSIFTGDLSRWDVSKVRDMHRMFDDSAFAGDVSTWDVRAVLNMSEMFVRTDYCGDLSAWRPESLAEGETVLTRHSLREMPHPCFFHWYGAIAHNRVFEPDILEFVHRHAPTMTALGLNPVQAALALQDHWMGQLKPAEPKVELPNLDY